MLPDLIDKINKLVSAQLKDGERAIYGRGDFMLRSTHIHLRVNIEMLETMSELEQKKKKRRCFVLNQKDRTVTSSNGRIRVVSRPDAGKKKNQRKRKRSARTTTPRKRHL